MENKKGIKKIVWLIFCGWLLFFTLYPAAGEYTFYKPAANAALVSPENFRLFSRELIIELEHYAVANVLNIKPPVEEQLLIFFRSYAYYKELAPFFKENINIKYWQVSGAVPKQMSDLNNSLLETIYKGLQALDKYKTMLFNGIKVIPGHAYTFGNGRCRSFVTIAIDSKLDEKQQEYLLFLLSAGLTLKNREKPRDAVCENQLQIRGVYLNWLFAGQEYVFTGGPGGLPVPGSAARASSCCCIECYTKEGKPAGSAAGQLSGQINKAGNYPVDVYILDTIPGSIQIQNAQAAYYPVNTLVRNLLDSLGTRFHIVQSGAANSSFYALPNEKYGNRDMSDHGIYIAGIIQCLSPYSNLHLVEALNRYGSGSLDALLWGFQLIWQKQQKKTTPFIINASWTTKIIPGLSTDAKYEIIGDYCGKDSILPLFYALDAQTVFFPALTWIIDFFRGYNGFLAAAAGNDSSTCPGYPACLGENPAFSHVLAVGACDRYGNVSSFSNLAGANGLLAFGGEVDWNGVTQDGSCSAYFSSLYQGTGVSNTTGWASWAGTSFSTGIVSGVMAALLSNGLYTIPGARNMLMSACYLNADNKLFLPFP